MNIHRLVNTKTRIAIAVLACAALITSGGVGAYALAVRSDAARVEAAMAEQIKQVHADMKKVAALPDTAQASSTATADGTPAAETPQAGPQTTATQSGQTKKTYTMTDGLTGQTTSYTEGCVTKRPGYPDADCDARAKYSTPYVPDGPTRVVEVTSTSSRWAKTCSDQTVSINEPNAMMTMNDSRGGYTVTLRYESTVPIYLASGPEISQVTRSITTKDLTNPNFMSIIEWYQSSDTWTIPRNPGQYIQYRVHILSPVDMYSKWYTIDPSTMTCGE